jgi:hypothetical protein
MQEIITRLALLEAAGAQANTFSGPSATVVQTASRDILSISERLAQYGERELVQNGERELGRAPSTELSAGHI